jgi:Fe-S cluster biosynthesis and repair protein YggX
MSRTVQCVKLNKPLPGLDHAPFQGELGRRIYLQVSAIAWKQWIGEATKLINELRLNPAEPADRAVLDKKLLAFLFGPGISQPAGYSPPA